MASNDTSWLVQRYVLYGAYLTEGLVIGGANLLVAVCLLHYEALRSCNRYMFFIAQSIADFINMLAYSTCGAYRIGLLLDGTHNNKVSLWDCALVPHRLLWGLWGDRLVSLIHLLIAFDRFISVAMPLEYMGWGSLYPVSLISAAYGLVTGMGLLGLYLEAGVEDKLVAKPCTNAVVRAAGDVYGLYFQLTPQILSLLSLPIYGAVVLLYRRQVTGVLDVDKREQLDDQRRFTKSVVINCVMNIVLFVVPFTLAQMSDRFGWGRMLATGNFVIANLYPLMDVVIFVVRHEELRQAIRGFFKRKNMPADLKLWRANTTAKIFIPSSKGRPSTRPASQQIAQKIKVQEL